MLFVFISVLSTLFTKSFGVLIPFLMKSHLFFMFFSFCRCCFTRERTSSFGLFGTNSSCVYMDANKKTKTKKKPQKEVKKRNKRSGCICSDFVFIETKNTDTEQSGQRIKSLFFILYIWKWRLQYVALLCCTNQMCLCHFSNLIYFTVLFLFHASPLKFKGCTQSK